MVNILIMIADDHRYCDMSHAGNADVSTPALDSLAAEGLCLKRYATPTPICAPARMSLLSGLFPVRNGGYPNHSFSYPRVRSVVRHLNELGYRCGIFGKKHIAPRKTYNFEEVEDLGAFMRRDDSQPFFLFVGFSEPHVPWGLHDRPRRDPESLRLPPYLLDTPMTRKQLAEYYSDVEKLDDKVGNVLEVLEQSGKKDDTLVIYTGDHGAQFPNGKWSCYEEGLRVPLIARWPGKIEAGSTTQALTQHVDIAPTLVEIAGGDPAALDCGVADARGYRGFDGISMLPLLKGETDALRTYTFGVHTQNLTGNGCVYPMRSVTSDRYKLIYNLNATITYSNVITDAVGKGQHNNHYWQEWLSRAREGDPRALFLTERFLHRSPVEFYDLDLDPEQMNNLTGDPRYATLEAEHAKVLADWMAAQGDLGLQTELEAERHVGIAWGG